MINGTIHGSKSAISRDAHLPGRSALLFVASLMIVCLLAALLVPKGFALAACGDALQLALIATATVLAFLNFLRTHSRVRVFWFLTFLGAAIWTASNVIWGFYEVWLRRPVPDSPIADILLFVKIIPLTTAFAAAPHRERRSPFHAFGLLDVSVIMIYALYLYGFGVLSYRLLPGAIASYNFRFNIAAAIGNQIFLIGAGAAFLTSQGEWKLLYRFYFIAALTYALASNFANAAIDLGRYYTGSVYDVPLVLALACFVSVNLLGRSLAREHSDQVVPTEPDEVPRKATFLSSHLAMIVMLSTPLMGLWLLSGPNAVALLRFRLSITLLTMLLLTLLLSVKQDLLTAGLFSSLGRLSETYNSIERFKSQLSQSERLAGLGQLVAHVANQIKNCMALILEIAARLSCRPDGESRVQGMAGKIGQYAQRTDALVENMLHFAQETPTRLAPVSVKPLLESALQLSRVAKVPDIRVNLSQDGECPPVLADSSQLLHVFVQLISNALDALQEVNGGSLEIKISHADSHLSIEFVDSGPGMREPGRVFEPFYTTKVVGKGTGLGLSTCYGILQQHQGEISCRNRLTGGACFMVRLPLAEIAAPQSAPAGPLLVDGAA